MRNAALFLSAILFVATMHMDCARAELCTRESLVFAEIALPALVPNAAVFDVHDFGAKGDGVAKDTVAVQKAIDAANAAGGGEVLLPKGVYLCGSIFLKSGVDFHLAEGAVLKGSPDHDDYNAVGIAPQNGGRLGSGDNVSGGHLLLCIEQKDVTLRGPGKVDGNVGAFLKMPDGSHPKNKMEIPWRPGQMVWIVESRNVAIRDIELADAPYWSCFVYGCEDVVVERANIHTVRSPHTYNGDGLDIDSSRRVRVTGCNISTADDSITLRADGARLRHSGDCADVMVSSCTLSSDCNAIRLGVGNGHIRDCSFRDIKIANTRYAVNAVGAWSRPEHGVDISRISFENMEIDAKGFCKFYYKMATESVFDGITFRHVRGKVREPSIFDDKPARPFRNLRFEDVRIDGETSSRIGAAVAVVSGTYVPNEGNIPVRVWQTTGKKPFREIRTTPFTVHAYSDKAPLDVDAAQPDHEFLGLGVSMTDASCWLLSQMPPEKRRALLEAVFSPEKGAGLSAVRLNIGASDYSTALYTYNDVAGDVEMKDFSVKRDDIYLFDMVREAVAVNPSMFLFAAPWSPPGWMKDTGSFVVGNFKDGCELALANYLCAYAKACKERGLPLGAVNIQNESSLSTGGSYPSCVFTGEQESRVAKVFARRLKEEGLDTKVWIWDHNYWGATNRVLRQLEDAELLSSIGGVAWHSYRPPAAPMGELHRKYPDVPFYHTEMGPSITTDERTEFWWCDRVFDALENGCRMFTGWNLCLTDDGQPLVGPHGCAGLVEVDPDTGDFTPSAQYRVFRHIGPFVRRGARLLHVAGERDGTRVVLFRNPTGEHVLVVGCTGGSANKRIPRGRIHVKYLNEWLAVPLPYGVWSLTTVVFGGIR